ncbi:hypothetical protein [Noviherbaspirillum pedocola]|uniref:Uncharacterized protein n=1 Tax=Noviherbaspirillum pedocola TaxID=2801341 RepID=A0A934T2F0_9BURK|nr:hypothetical protein [Noviherbaspirillum pedocola]MBK4737864.1 hypothetical protein [Noviherbaspirillum pedocola]
MNPQKYIEKLQRFKADPDIGELLDFDKIAVSRAFVEALEGAIEHYDAHRDTTFISNLLGAIQESSCYNGVLQYACDRIRRTPKFVDGALKFIKSDSPAPAHQTLAHYIKSHRGTARVVQTPKRPTEPSAPKKKSKRRPYLDMLDSPARLPGSFEGGRRR